ncbi:MAG: hypothetical protein EOP13_26485, partial [Pseudomonas sp.]|uniref:prealbumin-like fold domain-containing protein n=1 Tax=Pseudomonas sp. TaxID=306 RepID=UPI00120F35F3
GAFNFAQTNLASTPGAITTTAVNVPAPATPTAIAVSTLGTAVTLTETPVSGFALTGASCIDANSATTGNINPVGTLSGNVLSISASAVRAGAALTCSFTNTKSIDLRQVLGKVFTDNGAGGGTANDGVLNGMEEPLAGRSMRLTDCAVGVLDSTSTDSSGGYVLNVPTTVVLGTGLCVDEDRKQTETSTGASVGAVGLPSGVATTTAGSTYRYTRGDGTATSNRISFVFNGTNHIDLNFGEVKDSTFAASLALSGLPLSTLSYPHVFTAGTKGTVVFSITSSAATPAMTGWSEKIFFDALCEGRVLPGAQQLYPGAAGTSLTVTAGDKICIVVQQFIPSNASIGSKNLIVVEARFDYAGANPTLTSSYMLNDNSSVGDAALELVKEVRNVTQSSVKFEHTNQAKSGDVLEYRLSYANNAAVPIRNLVINDSVPSYSAFISAAQDVTPSTLTGCMKSTPANPLPAAEVDCAVTQTVGGKGPLQWRFVGALNPADRGSVLFRVKVD